MTSNRDPRIALEWQLENDALDLLALATTIRDRLTIIKRCAWNDTGTGCIFRESVQALAELNQMQEVLGSTWESLYNAAREAA